MVRAYIFALAITTLLPAVATAGDAAPPSELLQLEREVSLKMAHARDEGNTEPAKLKTLAQAQALDVEAEQAIKTGDFEKAENDLLRVKTMLRSMGI